MSDHIAAVREQAEKEAEVRSANRKRHPANLSAESWDYGNYFGFIDGATWLASRMTREKIAEAIHHSVYKTLDIEDLTDENYLELFDQADAILALLTEEDRASDT